MSCEENKFNILYVQYGMGKRNKKIDGRTEKKLKIGEKIGKIFLFPSQLLVSLRVIKWIFIYFVIAKSTFFLPTYGYAIYNVIYITI